MKFLYAPWRNKYVTEKDIDKTKETECVFCKFAQSTHQDAPEHDAKHFVIARFERCFVILNLFPYNPGHLLIIPYTHTNVLDKLSESERQELMRVITKTVTLLQTALNTDGMNVGLNLGGKAAGGSIPEHLHWHIIPRWNGDTNFLVTAADTKAISADLHELYKKLVLLFK